MKLYVLLSRLVCTEGKLDKTKDFALWTLFHCNEERWISSFQSLPFSI